MVEAMPQDSAIYAVSRIRSAERFLVTREKMKRFLEMSADEIARQLLEMGYGATDGATAAESEKLIASELMKANALVNEVTTNKKETDIYMLSMDVQNIKHLLKLRLIKSREEAQLEHGGLVDEKLLRKCVEEGEYKELPEELQAALDGLEASFASDAIDPARLSTALDSAYISYAYKHGSAFTNEYFRAYADFVNISAYFRARAMGESRERLALLLVTAGDIPHEAILKAYEQQGDALIRALRGAASGAMKKAIEEAEHTGKPAAIERERDNYLMRMASRGKNDTDTLRPVLGYLLAKRQEARAIRLVLTAKQNGLADEVIAERMRILYGE